MAKLGIGERGFDDGLFARNLDASIEATTENMLVTAPEHDQPQDSLGAIILDEVLSPNDGGTELGGQPERDSVLIDITRKYRSHPRVLSMIESAKDESVPLDLVGNVAMQYRRIANQFPILEKAKEQELFMSIEVGLNVYRKIQTTTAISNEQEAALIELTAAQQIIFLSNLRLVSVIAWRLAKSQRLPLEDLQQEGGIGLERAIRSFDVFKGGKFSTHATSWIRHSIGRAIEEKSRVIDIPVHVDASWQRLRKYVRNLELELQRPVTIKEIAEHTSMSTDQVRLLIRHGSGIVTSIDQPTSAHTDYPVPSVGETLSDPTTNADTFTSQISDKLTLQKLFAGPGLNDREKIILALRFGVPDALPPDLKLQPSMKQQNGLSLGEAPAQLHRDELDREEVGRILGISRARVRQIEMVALGKARKAISN